MSLHWTDPRTPRHPGWSWVPSFRERLRELWWKSRDIRGALLFLFVVGVIALTIYGWLQVVVWAE